MGQKVNPNGLRVGIIREHESKWYAEKDYAKYVFTDERIRVYLGKELDDALVSRIKIERSQGGRVVVYVIAARPGVVLGSNGENIAKYEKQVKLIEGSDSEVRIEVVAVESVDLDASCVAQMIAKQLENRANFRIVQKKAIQNTMRAGAKGIKTRVAGRLAGADMARAEGYSEGNVPLHTLRADIDYGFAEALTVYGQLGVKVWICNGEVLPSKETK